MTTARISVQLHSTTLATASYEASQSNLQLEFHDGAVYRYFQVPESTYRALLHADSHGRYFNRRIRGRFPYLQVQPSR